jgi:signal transduction histidine kinase
VRLLGAAIGAAGVLLAAAGGAFELEWEWAAVLTCACAGAALLVVAPTSPALYVGALARLGLSPAKLWTARALVFLSAPLAGAGPAVYTLVALVQALREPLPRELRPDWRRALGTGLIGLGFVTATVELGLSVGDETLLWSVLGGSAWLSAFWWSGGMNRSARISLAIAALLFLFVFGSLAVQDVDDRVLAGLAGAAIVLVVVAPRWLRSSRTLSAERARKARVEERAEVAEMVHDSVLQTLALIQSRADDPGEVKALARTQERALRERLFGERDPEAEPTSIATALRAVAAEVEDAHRVKIDVVTVGDGPLDERSAALVAAVREALFNAARHAPDAPLSLFVEVDERRIEAFVRDRGPGFDLEAVPADRRGITDSIVARMVRHGGHAAVRTAPGGGCEVRLVLERER